MSGSQPLPNVSNLRAMRALLAKDCRLFRAPILALVAIGLGCYPITLASISFPPAAADVPYLFFNTAMLACDVTVLLSAVFGGVALASERKERTADFLGVLPVSRSQIVSSKCIASATALGSCLALHLFVAFLFYRAEVGQLRMTLLWSIWEMSHVGFGWNLQAYWGAATIFGLGCIISLFGTAWLLGTFMESGPVCACVSIAATVAMIALAKALVGEGHWLGFLGTALFLGLPSMAIGLTSLVVGTLYYLRRIEP